MRVEKFTNNILSSNSYIIHTNSEKNVWVLDPGESEQLLDWINENGKTVKGILLTHTHIDHIYGVNDICDNFPELIIYASEFANEGMQSSKSNGSYYLEMPYVVNHRKIQFVNETSEIHVFCNNIVRVMYTPGHNNDCISFYTDNYLFTGDALISGVKPHTKSKKGDKKQALESIDRIIKQFDSNTILCPGHKEMILLQEFDLDKVFQNKLSSQIK